MKIGTPHLRKEAIEIEAVSKLFGKFQALETVTFDIYDNEFFTMLGPSGCGKTTLLRMMASLATPDEMMGGGEVAMHFWWDGNTMKNRMNDKAPVEYAAPKEGLVGWLDSLVVPKGAKNLDTAKAFINFMNEPENATIQYNFYGHSSPVTLDLSKAKYTPENAPELFPKVPVQFSKSCSPAAQDLVTKVWTQLLQ